MKVIVGRDPEQTKEAANAYGWEEASTDWQSRHATARTLTWWISPRRAIWHDPMVLEAAKAKKHIVCEKPLGNTLEEAERMAAAGLRSRSPALLDAQLSACSRRDAGEEADR